MTDRRLALERNAVLGYVQHIYSLVWFHCRRKSPCQLFYVYLITARRSTLLHLQHRQLTRGIQYCSLRPLKVSITQVNYKSLMTTDQALTIIDSSHGVGRADSIITLHIYTSHPSSHGPQLLLLPRGIVHDSRFYSLLSFFATATELVPP